MASILYDNRYEQIAILAGANVGNENQGAMAEVVLVKDRTQSNDEQYVLKRPTVSPGNLTSQRELKYQNDAIIKEIEALKVANNIQGQLSCCVPAIIKSGIDNKNFSPHSYNYFINTKAKGNSLSNFISPPPPLIAVLNIYARIIESLQALHKHFIVFNDTRHEHFFWDESIDPTGNDKNSITLIDFGNAYFLSGSNLEQYNFKESLEKKAPKDDFAQLGESLYRLITGSEIESKISISNISLKSEYRVIETVFDLQRFSVEICSAINYLLSDNADSAKTILANWSNAFNQHREIELSKITERVEKFSSVEEIENVIKEKYLIIGKPDSALKSKWDAQFTSLSNIKVFEDTKRDVYLHIQKREWRKLLAGPLSVLFKQDPEIKEVFGTTIENLKSQKVTDEQVAILLKIVSRDFAGAINDLERLFRENKFNSEDNLVNFSLPLASNIYRLRKDIQPSSHYVNLYTSSRECNNPEGIIKKYEGIINGIYGNPESNVIEHTRKIIEKLNQASAQWEKLNFDKCLDFINEAKSLDKLNPAIQYWMSSCELYEIWSNGTSIDISKIPSPSKFEHIALSNLKSFENNYDHPQTMLHQIAGIEKPLQFSIKPDLQNWAKNKRSELANYYKTAAEEAIKKPQKDRLQALVTDNEISNYMKDNLPEWQQLCWCFYHFPEEQQNIKFNELEKIIDKYINNSQQRQYWKLLKKGLEYFQQRFGNFEDEVIKKTEEEFKNISIDLEKNSDPHWLYRLFVMREQAGNAESYFRLPNYPAKKQKDETLVATPIKTPVPPSKDVPENTKGRFSFSSFSFFLGSSFSAISLLVLMLAYLFLTNKMSLFLDNTSVATTPTTEADIKVSNCEKAINLIEKSDYLTAQEYISYCNAPAEKDILVKKLISQSAIDLIDKKYDPNAANIYLAISAFPGIDENDKRKLQDINLCYRYLDIYAQGLFGNSYFSKNELTSWIDLGIPGQPTTYDDWQESCVWNPNDLILDINKIALPHTGKIAEESGVLRILINYETNPEFAYLPKTNRYYETTIPVIAGNSSIVYLQEDAIPGTSLSIDLKDLYVINEKKERKIKVYWKYNKSNLEIGYTVYAPLEAVSAVLMPGTTLEDFAAANKVSKETVLRLNPEIDIDSTLPVSLIITEIVDPTKKVQFPEDIRSWYEVNSSSVIFLYNRDEATISLLSPEIKIEGAKIPNFPTEFELSQGAENLNSGR